MQKDEKLLSYQGHKSPCVTERLQASKVSCDRDAASWFTPSLVKSRIFQSCVTDTFYSISNSHATVNTRYACNTCVCIEPSILSLTEPLMVSSRPSGLRRAPSPLKISPVQARASNGSTFCEFYFHQQRADTVYSHPVRSLSDRPIILIERL